MCDRIIALVDMDCFYCQVETRINPALVGKPMAVVQYNPWMGGGIIAVNYEARAFGVTRHIRGNEAKQKCRDIILVQVPEVRGKADLTRYRNAGKEVLDVLCEFSECVEKASVDEAYLDLTQAVEKRLHAMKGVIVKPEQLANTFVVGFASNDSNDEEGRAVGLLSWLDHVYNSDFCDETAEKLTIAGLIVEEMRTAIYTKTGFQCSAGIAHNKILGKLACGLHKPNRQTVLPHSGVADLYSTLSVKKVRNLGGKLGDAVMDRLGCKVMADLSRYSESQLQQHFDEKTGSWLYNIARGIDVEPVTPRLMSKSIACCKKFPGKQALATKEEVSKRLLDLAVELSDRLVKELAENKRRASMLTIAYQQSVGNRTVSSSRCGPLTSYEPQGIANEAAELLKKNCSSGSEPGVWDPPLKFLGLSATKFVGKNALQASTMHNFFKTEAKGQDVKNKELEKSNSNETSNKESKITEGNLKISLEDLVECSYSGKKDIEDVISNGKLDQESFFVRYFKRENLSARSKNITISKEESAVAVTPSCSNLKGVQNTAEKKVKYQGLPPISEEPSTSHHAPDNVSDDSGEHWVSLQEIFPDLDQVDNDVVSLLPSPMQRSLHSRLEKHRLRNQLVHDVHDIKECDLKQANDNISIEAKDLMSEKADSSGYNPGREAETVKHLSFVGYHGEISPDIMEGFECHATNNSMDGFSTADNGKHLVNNNVESEVKNPSYKAKTASNDASPLVMLPCRAEKDLPIVGKHINMQKEKEGKVALQPNSVSVGEHVMGNGGLADFDDPFYNMRSAGEVCPHCHRVISLLDYPEHLDFHVAEELDKHLNNSVNAENQKLNTNNIPSKVLTTKSKRGKTSKKQQPATSNKKMKSIRSFFSPIP